VTIVRIGATKRYSDGWEMAFGKGKKKQAAGSSAAKKAGKKSAKAKKGRKR
jgi:hypothetical protein